MNWFLKVFSQEKVNSIPLSGNGKKQDFTNVLHMVLEETIMTGAQWLIILIKEMLASKETISKPTVETPPEKSVDQVNELNLKITHLIDQLQTRTASLLTLEQNLSATHSSSAQAQSPQSVSSNLELVQEDSSVQEAEYAEQLQKIDALMGQFKQQSERINFLEQRLIYFEKLLTRYSVIPKVIQQQHHEIVALQHRIAELESSAHTNNHHPNNHHTNNYHTNNHRSPVLTTNGEGSYSG